MTSSASLPQMQNTHSHLHLIAQVAPDPGTAPWRPWGEGMRGILCEAGASQPSDWQGPWNVKPLPWALETTPAVSTSAWDMLEGIKRETHTPWKQKRGRDPGKSKNIQNPGPPLHFSRAKPGPSHLFCGFNTLHFTHYKHITCFRGSKQFLLRNRAVWSADLGHPRLELRPPRPQAAGPGRETQVRQGSMSIAAEGEGTKVTMLSTASSWLRVIAAETVFLLHVNGLWFF